MRWFRRPGTQTIVFKARSASESLVQPKPFPASKAVPDWWKKTPPFTVTPDNPDGKKVIVKNMGVNTSFKKCIPMLDAITSGYIVPLWADVQVRKEEDGSTSINWKTWQDVFVAHGESSYDVPPPPGYSNEVFKYNNCWIPQTPPGYSVLVTAPVGERDLPFHAIPAIIDSDKSTHELVFPMWLREGFEGIVEAGTPLVQITPFKRTDWVATFDSYKDGEFHHVEKERTFRRFILGHYVRFIWSKKTYT